MSMTQTTMEATPTGDLHCPKCKAVLPRQASFCASCGERISNKNVVSLAYTDTDITTRYRITSLVRRRPYVSLYFAVDNQHQRPVVIREIMLRTLQDEGRLMASQVVQREYDLLRREHISGVLPVIDLLHWQGQLYVVAAWPHKDSSKTATAQTLHTLQEVLQSGIGLPKAQRALAWIEQLCNILEHLHTQRIVLGDLDPQALIFNGDSYESELALMPFWLPGVIRDLLPPTSSMSNTSSFSAPEVLVDRPEPRSDVYSLGAILYLLLTGVAPDDPTVRMQHRLRSPNELNFRISHAIDEFVMQALALEPSERFLSIREMGEALYCVRMGIKRSRNTIADPLPEVVEATPPATAAEKPLDESVPTPAEIADIKTILITPIPSTEPPIEQETQTDTIASPQPVVQEAPAKMAEAVQDELVPPPPRIADQKEQEIAVQQPTAHANDEKSLVSAFKKRITGILPAIPRSQLPKPLAQKPTSALSASPQSPPAAPVPLPQDEEVSEKDRSLLKRLQQLILGEQKPVTSAAALIETPMRVQPNQSYTIRIQLMGRNKPHYPDPVEAHKGARVGGLSALVEGEMVYIEVRSALYQSYAYIVQQAAVALPGQGYAAEVTIPMQPLSTGPNGRRDRLHIFFMDDMRRPLYEKPFVVELFISSLVQPGREGHNVLTIPL